LEKPLNLQPGHKYDIVVSSPSGVPVAKIEDKGLKSVTESIKVVLFGE